MVEKAKWVHYLSILSLKIMYYYAKVFGLVYFTITPNHRIKYSFKTHVFAVAYRITCLVAFTILLPILVEHTITPLHSYLRAMVIIQVISIYTFNIVFIVFQVIRHKQFISVVNRSIDIFLQILTISGDSQIFGHEFYIVAFGRFFYNLCLLLVEIPKFRAGFSVLETILNLSGRLLGLAVLVTIDILYLGYMTSAGMYRNMGKHMVSFVKRIEIMEGRTMSKFRQMQALCDFSEELDQCSEIYSKIFKITREFHSIFQYNILFMFYTDLIIIIVCIHRNFVTYLTTGSVMWDSMVTGTIRVVDFILLVLVIDLAVRRSRIPGYFHWDCLCSDIDSRWDRSVEHFLSQLKFEDLKIDVLGLFQLNNALCLRVFSIIVAYLTIVIQFSMLGYFKDDVLEI